MFASVEAIGCAVGPFMLCQVGGWCEQQAAALLHAAPAGKWVSGAARSCLTSLAEGLVWVLGGRLSPISGIALHTNKLHGIC